MAAPSRWIWLACFAFGVIVIGLTAAFAAIANIDACASTPAGQAWVTLQRALTPNDIANVLRPDCAAALRPALEQSFLLDATLYIPAYGAFLGLALLALGRGRGVLMGLGLAALAAGMVSDQVEGFALRAILHAWPEPSNLHPVLAWASDGKLMLLGLTGFFLGLLIIKPHRLWRSVGLIVCAASVAAMGARLVDDRVSTLGIAVTWLVIFLIAAVRGLSSRSAPN